MRKRIIVGTALIALTTGISEAATFTLLGDLPGGTEFSRALAISADGNVVVGDSSHQLHYTHAFRWTATGGMVDLGELPNPFGFGESSYAYGVSGNGSTITGVSGGFPIGGAYRWTSSTGMVPLAEDQGSQGPTAISSDGSVIVGSNHSTGEAFRWTSAGGFVGLGDLPGGRVRSDAWGVSADGSVIVGSGEVSDNFIPEAFKWTATDGMVSLGGLPGGGVFPGGQVFSVAYAVSGDGTVIVGRASAAEGAEAFRWTAAGGMVGLGDLPTSSVDSTARAVSADGSVVVGTGATFNGPGGNARDEAFIWTAEGGMQRLLDVLVAQGATGLDGWLLLDAMGVSADGSAIVGMAEDASGKRLAYVARVSTVPIPPAIWLLASALGGMGWVRWKAAK